LKGEFDHATTDIDSADVCVSSNQLVRQLASPSADVKNPLSRDVAKKRQHRWSLVQSIEHSVIVVRRVVLAIASYSAAVLDESLIFGVSQISFPTPFGSLKRNTSPRCTYRLHRRD
jgi:hypothetical protein